MSWHFIFARNLINFQISEASSETVKPSETATMLQHFCQVSGLLSLLGLVKKPFLSWLCPPLPPQEFCHGLDQVFDEYMEDLDGVSCPNKPCFTGLEGSALSSWETWETSVSVFFHGHRLCNVMIFSPMVDPPSSEPPCVWKSQSIQSGLDTEEHRELGACGGPQPIQGSFGLRFKQWFKLRVDRDRINRIEEMFFDLVSRMFREPWLGAVMWYYQLKQVRGG